MSLKQRSYHWNSIFSVRDYREINCQMRLSFSTPLTLGKRHLWKTWSEEKLTTVAVHSAFSMLLSCLSTWKILCEICRSVTININSYLLAVKNAETFNLLACGNCMFSVYQIWPCCILSYTVYSLPQCTYFYFTGSEEWACTFCSLYFMIKLSKKTLTLL